jgi:hypothetical protein
LADIAALDGYFVRRGSLRGKRRRQKEVDVLLAVDMLSHSHRRNTDRMMLLGGDLDFRPLVEALVDQGTIVTVDCDARGSKELTLAADSQKLLTLRELWDISTGRMSMAAGKAWPQVLGNKPQAYREVQDCNVAGVPGQLLAGPGDAWIIDVDRFGLAHRLPRFYMHADRSRLMRFVEAEFATVEWS